MAITVASSFDQTAGVPLDSRFVVADLTARDAIASGIRYEGLTVYVTAEAKNYQLVGGITDGDWTELQGAGGGGINYILAPDGTDITGWSTYFDSQAVTFTDAGDLVNLTAHGLSNGQVVSFTSITSTTGISVNTAYYVVSAATNTFQVSATSGGSALTLTTDGSGTLVIDRPLNGTGGSASSTFAVSTDSSLVGTENFLWTKSANNRMSEGFSYDFSIDQAYQSKPLTVSFLYKVASGTYVDGDMTVWIFDVTNSVLIQPSAYSILNASGATIQKCEFQTASNSTSYRLIVHTSSVSAAAYTLRFDSISVSPNTYNSGSVDTEPVAYTPTFTGFGTVSVQNFKSWRSGKYLFVDGTFTCGTVTATEARITLGYNGTNANVTTVSTLPTLSQVGAFSINVNGANAFTVLTEASKNYLTLGNGYVSGASLAKGNGDIVGGTGAIISLFGRFEIEGWGTSQVLSSETDTRVVSGMFSTLSSTTVTSGTAVRFTTVIKDTHASYNTANGQYTISVPGDYEFTCGSWLASSGGNDFDLHINGSSVLTRAFSMDTGARNSATVVYPCKGGDIVTVVPSGSSTASSTTGFFFVRRISGPAQVAASEKVFALYTGNAGGAQTADTTNVDFATKVVDSHGSFNGTTFTAPRPGWYDFKAVVNCTTSASRSFSLFIGGTKKLYMFSVQAAGTSVHGAGVASWYMNAGETATIRLDTNGTLSNNAINHWVAISSQG